MPSFPKFGEDLADAERRIGAILDREASGKGRDGEEPRGSEVQDGTQDLVPPETMLVGGDVFRPGDQFVYQLPLSIGSYKATVTVVNVDPRTNPLPTPLPLDIPVELRVGQTVVATLTFTEPLAFGSELTKTASFPIRDARAGGLPVSVVVINHSRYSVRIGAQFERELEL